MLPVAIASLIGVGLLKQGAFEITKFILMRAMIIGITMVLVPLAVFHGLGYMCEFMMNYAGSKVTGAGLTPTVVSLTGIAGYLGSACRLPEAFSIYLSFVSLGFLLKMVRIK